MGVVKYSPGIEYVKGSLAKPKKQDGHNHGDYLIGTHREAATTSTECTRLYVRKGDTYKRTTPISNNETLARTRFASVAASVSARSKDLSKIAADQQAFEAQKNNADGKKTIRAWYWMVEGQAYDTEHPRS